MNVINQGINVVSHNEVTEVGFTWTGRLLAGAGVVIDQDIGEVSDGGAPRGLSALLITLIMDLAAPADTGRC